MNGVKDFIDEITSSHHVVVFFKTNSADSEKVRELLNEIGATHYDVEIDQLKNYEEVRKYLAALKGEFDPTPSVFLRERFIGGLHQVDEYIQSGRAGEFLDN